MYIDASRGSPNIKPPMWAIDPGIVAYNCLRHGIPLPVLAMPMWEGAGNQAMDLSGYGNHGTINGADWVVDGLNFDGVDNYVEIPDGDSLDFNATQSFSFSYWVKFPTGAVNPKWSIGKGDAYNGPGYGVAHWHTTDVPVAPSFYFNDDGVPRVSLSAGTIARGDWGHFVWTIDRTTNVMKSYKNGAYVGQVSVAGIGDTSNADDLYIGRHVTSRFTGSIGEICIYNRVLVAAQAKLLYNNPYFMYQIPEEFCGYAGVPISVFLHLYNQMRQ